MKNLRAIYNTFTSQTGPNDCGIACLSMLLNYQGRYNDADKLIMDYLASENGLSLLELRNMARDLQLSSRCVIMDLESLQSLKTPCILHTTNHTGVNHFVVCFGAEIRGGSYRYLIADPATQMHFVSENELINIWPDFVALYVEPIRFIPTGFPDHPWLTLLKIKTFRKALLISVPFLNICSTILGIALSWMLQRGINDSLTDKKTSIVTAAILLLLVITLFKSLLSYVRQYMLIMLNSTVRDYLTGIFIKKVVSASAMPGMNEHTIKKGFADIQKIQHALSAFIAVLVSDGCVVSMITASLWYCDPAVAFINTTYLVLVTFLAIRISPEIAYQQASLHELSASGENRLFKTTQMLSGVNERTSDLKVHMENQMSWVRRSNLLAIVISRYNLWYEWIGTVNVIAVYVFCLYHVTRQSISYNTLMAEVILSYFVTALVPKVCNVFSVITEGSRLARRYLNI